MKKKEIHPEFDINKEINDDFDETSESILLLSLLFNEIMKTQETTKSLFVSLETVDSLSIAEDKDKEK